MGCALLSASAKIGMTPRRLTATLLLVPGKKYPETSICKIYGKKSVRITGSLPYFRILLAWNKYVDMVVNTNHGIDCRLHRRCCYICHAGTREVLPRMF